VKDDKEIVDQVKKIRKRYKTELVDVEEVEMDFIDEVNSLIKKIFGDSSNDVYTALTPGKLEKWKNSRKRKIRNYLRKFTSIFTRKNFLNFMYFLLLCTITGFLVSEAVSFYAVDGVIEAKTWVKAILTEVCFIFLSGYRAIGKMQTFFVGILRVAVFCLMLFVITSGVAFQGASDVSEISNVDKQIEMIERSIEKKEELIKFFKEKRQILNTIKQENALDKLREKLLELKNRQLETGKSQEVSDLIVYKSYGKAAFRVILLFISVLLSRRMFKF
jgi:hypothetical protein